jgi:hypothetical protein
MVRGRPVIRCLRCLADVLVPVFTGDDWEPVPTREPPPSAGGQLEDAEPAATHVAGELPEADPEPPKLVERRRPGRTRRPRVACRSCGGDVELATADVQLAWTHARMVCPGCGEEVRLRRGDASRDTDSGLPWVFASYATGEPEEQEPGRRRLFRRVH